MSHHDELDAGEAQESEDELSSGEDDDDGLREDMEALRQACLRTGADPEDLHHPSDNDEKGFSRGGGALDSESEDDLELFRSIRERFQVSNEECETLSRKPLCILPPDDFDDDDDDFETLRAIQRRFSAYAAMDNQQKLKEERIGRVQQLESNSVNLADAAYDNLKKDASERLKSFEESCITKDLSSDNGEILLSDINQWDQTDVSKPSTSEPQETGLPDPANDFVVAIRRNRAYQKFLRSKLAHIEAKIEENKKLKERVKLLRDFQVSCRKSTGRGLSLRKDPRVQLISSLRCHTSKGEKSGPPENPHVANYRSALTRFPPDLHRDKWSKEDRENLLKGVRQQIQELELCDSMERSHGMSDEGQTDLDGILSSIRNLEITPEGIRARISQIDWDQLASMYVVGRCGAECAARWLNHEDPLINRSPWTAEEDKQLLSIVQKEGITDFCSVAACLGTDRNAYQCLVRYQRSLNADMLNREWTTEEDDQLRDAVKIYGESNWQSVASTLEKRSGAQCSERWKKSLVPTTKGKWTLEESKRLKVAVAFFGPKCWNKIAQFVPGRGQAQCRERWVNVLDPSLSSTKWSEREDSLLEEAIEEHGYHWSRVAACIPPRTDNECWRRWKALHPEEAAKLAAARKQVKKLIPSNFVDRKSERPALDPVDIIELPLLNSGPEKNIAKQQRKQKRNPSSAQQGSKLVARISSSSIIPGVAEGTTGGDETEAGADLERESFGECDTVRKNRKVCSGKTRSKMGKIRTKKCSMRGLARTAGRSGNIGEHETTGKKKRTGRSRKKFDKAHIPVVQRYSGEDLRITDGNEAEPPGDNVCIKKRTEKVKSDESIPRLPKEGAVRASLEVQAGIDGDQAEHDASTEKRKRHLTRNISNLKTVKDGILPTSMSLLSTNEMENDCFTRGNVVESERSRRKARKNPHNRPYEFSSDECSVNSLQSGTTDDADMMHDSGVPGTINSEEVVTLYGDDMNLACLLRNQSKKRRLHSSANENCLVTDEDDMKLAHFLRNKSKRRNQNLYNEDSQNLARSSKSNREKHRGIESGENMKVASFQDKKLKKKRRRIENEDFWATDEENMTLACFLRRPSTVRRNEHLGAFHPSPITCHRTNKTHSPVSHRRAETGSGCVNPENTRCGNQPKVTLPIRACEQLPGVAKNNSNVGIPDLASGSDSESTSKVSDLEDDDVILSTLRRRLKKTPNKRLVRASVKSVR